MEATTKRYNYRAYPTGDQRRKAIQAMGCARVVYNAFLEERNNLYKDGRHKDVPFGATSRNVTTVLKQHPHYKHLQDVPNVVLQQSVRDAETAYRNFFNSVSGKRKGPAVKPPRYKGRSNRQAIRYTRDKFKVRTEPGCKWAWLWLAKMGNPKHKSSWIKFSLSRPLPSDPSSVTLVRNADQTWEVSFVVTVPNEPVVEAANEARVAGIDVGVGDCFAAISYSDGTREKIENPRNLREAEKRLARAQKSLSRKVPGSANWDKQRVKVAKVHRDVVNARENHHRHLAQRLVRENSIIARETLSLAGMKRTRLGKSVADAAIGRFFELIAEEAENQERTVHKCDRFEPTTRVCSVCGLKGAKKPLYIRVWTCESCGTTLDRDWNAATNIMFDALSKTAVGMTVDACGEDVRRRLSCAAFDDAGTHRTDHDERCVAA